MTEAEWLAATDPAPMLRFLEGTVSHRKLRLFAVGCCAHAGPLLTDPLSRAAVEVASRHADGDADQHELETARRTVAEFVPDQDVHVQRVIACAICTEPPLVIRAAYDIDQLIGRQYDSKRTVHRAKAGTVPTPRYTTLLRCVVGSPFHPVAFAPEWRTATAVALARQMYESRDFSAMPILADALQDAGCDSDDILAHCRSPDTAHVRGCWVLDLVLGK